VSLSARRTEFERALGVGKKTVVRWERGTVPPSRAANGMLWLAGHYPSVFLEYARQRSHSRDDVNDVSVVATIVPAASETTAPLVLKGAASIRSYTAHAGQQARRAVGGAKELESV